MPVLDWNRVPTWDYELWRCSTALRFEKRCALLPFEIFFKTSWCRKSRSCQEEQNAQGIFGKKTTEEGSEEIGPKYYAGASQGAEEGYS